MVNNEFHIIGVATTNYQNIGNGRFVSYILRVEVEKMGSKNGKNFELEVQVYGTNEKIDTRQDVLGCQIAVNGYLDSYTTKDGNIVCKIVAQNVYLLEKKHEHPVVGSYCQPNNSKVGDEFPELENASNIEVESSDDDLPF